MVMAACKTGGMRGRGNSIVWTQSRSTMILQLVSVRATRGDGKNIGVYMNLFTKVPEEQQ